jgi:membrane protease YdiL (CAAX protease family)
MENSMTSKPAVRNLTQVMRQHPLLFFFLMAYAFSWIMLIPYVLSVWGILPGDYTFTFVLNPFVGPTLAAFIMTGLTEGKAGIARLRLRIKQWRAGWQWYVFILLGIPVMLLIGVVVMPGALASFQGLKPLILVSYPITFLAVFFGGGPLGEEIGWRGFALPRLQARFGPLGGTLLLGILWVFWHLPHFLTPAQGGGPGTGLATFVTNFPIFTLMVLAMAIIFTWVFNHTRASIFTAILTHAGINTPQLVWIPLFAALGVTSMNLAALVGFGVPALLIVILTRGRLGYQPGQEQSLLPGAVEAQPAL